MRRAVHSGGPSCFAGTPRALRIDSAPMSTVAIVVVIAAALLLLLIAGGFLAARRQATRPGVDDRIRAVDRALEQARAGDRGWDRDTMSQTARQALAEQRPELEVETIDLVLVDDRPGVTEDR